MKINPLSTPIARGFKCYHLASQQKIIICMFSYNSSLRWYMVRMNKFPLLEPNQRLSLCSGKNNSSFTRFIKSQFCLYFFCSCWFWFLKPNLSSFPCLIFCLLFCFIHILIYSIFIGIQSVTLFSSSQFIHLYYNINLLLPYLHCCLFLTLSLLCDRNCSCVTKSVSNSIQLSRFNCIVWTLKQSKSG